MGVSIGDFNRDGRFDIVKTNFAGDTDSLYSKPRRRQLRRPHLPLRPRHQHPLSSAGASASSTSTTTAGSTSSSANGHVYPEVDGPPSTPPTPSANISIAISATASSKRSPPSPAPASRPPSPLVAAPSATTTTTANMDVVVNCVNSLAAAPPLRLHHRAATGSRSASSAKSPTAPASAPASSSPRRPPRRRNRHRQTPFLQIEEVRSGGSYYSQNDLRIHFGLDHATKADMVEIHWPSGTTDNLPDLPANHLYVIQEGGSILKTLAMGTSSAIENIDNS